MAVSFITAVTNPQPWTAPIVSTDKILSVMGVNPVDSTAIKLKNVRGRLYITIHASDDPVGTRAMFEINGGYGQWPDDYTWNWYISTPSLELCTVEQLVQNVFKITTLAPLVIREYTMTFNPRMGFDYGPTIQRTSGALLGASDLEVYITKILVTSQNFIK